MEAERNDDVVITMPEEASGPARVLVFAKAITLIAILDWEGVGDVNGHTIPISPEGINALLDFYPAFEAFQLRYVSKELLMDAEKNVSVPLPNGSSRGAQATAPPVRKRANTARAESTGH